MNLKELIRPARAYYLTNGLKYIVHEDHANPLLCLQLYIRIGSAWESEAEAGFSHFLEHLTFKSTLKYTYNQISERVAELGGSINAYTDFDCTCYYLLLPSEFLQEGLQILAEIAINPCFSEADVNTERDIIIEEIKQYENDPELDFFEYIQTSCFKDNPLKKPVLGNIKSVRDATHARLKQFQARYYQAANSFLVLAGDLDPDALHTQMSQLWDVWEDHQVLLLPDNSRFLEPKLPPEVNFQRKNSQEFVAWVLPELCEAHPQNDALLIAMRYLATGRSSRLYKRLVEEEKLCSTVKVDSITGSLSGVSPIVVTTLNSKFIPRIHEIFRQEYYALLHGVFDPAEFVLVKQDIIHSWLYGFQGMENLANMIGAEEFIEGFEKLYDYDLRVQSVSMEEVLAAVRKYWQPSYLAVYHQGPKAPPKDLLDHSVIPVDSLKPIPRTQQAILDSFELPTPSEKGKVKRSFSRIETDYFGYTLPNGLKLIYHQLTQQAVCGFALSTTACQLMEAQEQHGLNYLCSAAMIHSTQLHPYKQLMRVSREKGFNIRVEQHLDSTVFLGKCFAADLDIALSILAEILAVPAFEADHIRLIKSATIDSLHRDAQNPASYAYQRWFRMLFGKHSPYDRCSGEIMDIRHQTRSAIQAWHEQHYQAGSYSLALVGPWEPGYVLDLVARLFSATPSSNVTFKADPAQPVSASIRKLRQSRNSGQAIIHLGGFAPAAVDQRHTTAFHILTQIVGGDMDSRLFNILREKYGYAYQTGMDFTSVKRLGYWNAYAYCDPDDYKACYQLMQEIVADVSMRGVQPQELLRAQNYLCGMHRFEQENPTYQAAMLSNLSALGYDPQFYLQREERIRSVDLDTIQLVANNWLQPTNTFTHILL